MKRPSFYFSVTRSGADRYLRFILQYQELHTYRGPTVGEIQKSRPSRRSLSTLRALRAMGLIQLPEPFSSDTVVHSTHAGECYFLKRCLDRRAFWFKSVLIPIALSAVTTVLTLWLRALLSAPPAPPA